MSLDDYLAVDHILVSFSGGFTGRVDKALKRRRLKRCVVASVPMFTTAMVTVAHSELAATVPSRLAAKYAKRLGLAIFDAPVKVDPFTISLVRHARSASDFGLDWLANKIIQAGKS
jgi:DNA-binding transcriptional LysR family regulator